MSWSCLDCIYLQMGRFRDTPRSDNFLPFRKYGCAKNGEIPFSIPLADSKTNGEIGKPEKYLSNGGCSNFKEKTKEEAFKQLSIFDL